MDDQGDNIRIFEYSNIRNSEPSGYCKIRRDDLVDISALIVHLMMLINGSKSKHSNTSEAIKEASRITSMLSAMIQERDCE